MNLTKARELREERGRIVAEARSIYDKSNRTKEDDAKFDEMMSRADELKTQIDREERLESAETEVRNTGAPPNGRVESRENDEDEARVAEYTRAERRHGAEALKHVSPESRAAVERANARFWEGMRSYLIYGDAGMPEEARNALNGRVPSLRGLGVGNIRERAELRDMGTGGGNALQGTGGGYFVPVGFVDDVEVAMKWYGDMLRSSTIMRTATGQPLPYPTTNDTTVTGVRIAEGIQVTEADIALGNITFGAWKYSTNMVRVSLELLQDSAFDLESFCKEQFATRLGRILNTELTTGTGAANSMPNGILTAATAGPVATGASANDGGTETGGTSIGTDDLVELEHSVDKAYRRGAAWMANDSTIKTLKKLKDKYGRPIWVPGIAVNAPDTILDYEYFTNNDLPVIALSAKTMLFGQLKKYMIRQVKELAVLRLTERYADYGQVAFLGFARYDGNLLDAGTHPVKYLTQAAS